MPARILFRSLPLVPVVALCSGGQVSLSRYISNCSACSNDLSPQEQAKKLAGYKSIDDYVKSGMVVGLGTGSTAKFAVERLGEKIKSGELSNIVAIPTSVATANLASKLGIPLATLNEYSKLDVAIDGADQIDGNHNLVKGGGGALLREKMVEMAAQRFVVIADKSKVVDKIGPGFPIPVEIVPFCHEHTTRIVESLPSLKGCQAVLRRGSAANNKHDGSEIAITDNGNYIIDLHFDEPLNNISLAAEELTNTVGVVEHGLFVGMASCIILAGDSTTSIIDCKQKLS